MPVVWANSLAVLAACVPLWSMRVPGRDQAHLVTAPRNLDERLVNRLRAPSIAWAGRLSHPAVMPGIAIAGIVFVGAMTRYAMRERLAIGYDAHAYYQAAALDDPYRATINGGFDAVGGLYEYKYPPPLAQVLAPLADRGAVAGILRPDGRPCCSCRWPGWAAGGRCCSCCFHRCSASCGWATSTSCWASRS